MSAPSPDEARVVELYAQLAAFAAEEHRLVMDGRYDELDALTARREPLVAALPAVPPHAALGHLQEALRVQSLVTLALREARDATREKLVAGRRTQDGARGYNAVPTALTAGPGRVDQTG